MSISKSVVTGIGAAVLMSSFSIPALAGPSEALAGCKTEIAGDARLSDYAKVMQRTDEIKRRGRYTSFEIKVNATAANGETAAWRASCKARGNGKVEALELVQLKGDSEAQVAASGS